MWLLSKLLSDHTCLEKKIFFPTDNSSCKKWNLKARLPLLFLPIIIVLCLQIRWQCCCWCTRMAGGQLRFLHCIWLCSANRSETFLLSEKAGATSQNHTWGKKILKVRDISTGFFFFFCSTSHVKRNWEEKFGTTLPYRTHYMRT